MMAAIRLRFCLILVLAGIAVLGVGSESSRAVQSSGYDASLIKATYTAADRLEKHLVSELNRVMPILSTGFVNLEHPGRASTFGRLLGEQIASRFSQHGYKVIELGMPKQGLFTKEKNDKPGRLMDPKGIGALYEAQAVIVGDYVVSNDLAYVSVRLLKIPDNEILTSCDFPIRLNGELKEMANRVPPDASSPRKPVKNMALSESGNEVSKKDPKQELPGTKMDREPAKKPVEKPKNGPFATGAILLNPKNRLAAKIIQARLAELGFYKDRIDGIWKEHSRKALREFKEAHGLKYALRWDMKTQKALFRGTAQ